MPTTQQCFPPENGKHSTCNSHYVCVKETLTSNHQADKKALLKKRGANCFGWKCAAVGIAVVCQAVSKKCISPPPSTPLHMCVCRGRAHSSLAYSSPCLSGPTYVGVYVGIYICTYICVYVCSSENAPDVCIGQEG